LPLPEQALPASASTPEGPGMPPPAVPPHLHLHRRRRRPRRRATEVRSSQSQGASRSAPKPRVKARARTSPPALPIPSQKGAPSGRGYHTDPTRLARSEANSVVFPSQSTGGLPVTPHRAPSSPAARSQLPPRKPSSRLRPR
jgi:hypothetical protein